MIKRYIITGGPGSGKTSVLDLLRKEGYTCVDERARALIDKALKEGTGVVPWEDLSGFNRLVVDEQIKDYSRANGITFFDRGLPDNVAYFWHTKQEMPSFVFDAAEEYHYEPIVFLAPAWKEIYRTDDARKETYEDALGISEMIRKSYVNFGYQIIELPKTTVEKRVEFIKEMIGKE